MFTITNRDPTMHQLSQEYSKNIIINFDAEEKILDISTQGLQRRILFNANIEDWAHNYWDNKQMKIPTINTAEKNLKDRISDSDREVLSKVDAKTRIYIIGHSRANSDYINGNHYSVVGEYLAAGIDKQKLISQNRSLRISLISCQAAAGGSDGVNSIAAKLHHLLAQLGIKTEVVARTLLCDSGYDPKLGKETSVSPLSNIVFLPSFLVGKAAHHVPGSKADFIWDDRGRQIRVDSYIKAFERKTKKLLNRFQQEEIVALPEVKEIKALLNQGEELDKETIGKIVELLSKLEKKLYNTEDELMRDFKKGIIALRDRAKSSISSSSLAPADLARQWAQPTVYKSIREGVQQDFIDPFVTAFQSLPETPGKAKLGEDLEKLVCTLAKMVEWKKETDQTIAKEDHLKHQLLSLLAKMQSEAIKREDIDALCKDALYAFRNHTLFDKIYHTSCRIFSAYKQVPSIIYMPFAMQAIPNVAKRISQNMDNVKDKLHIMLDELEGGKKSALSLNSQEGDKMKKRIYEKFSEGRFRDL